MIHFCTYCDQKYVGRMLCLHQSLCEQGEPFLLFVLCFDDATESVVKAAGQSSMVAVALREVLDSDPAFAAVRSGRTTVEFYFTSTPVLVRHCLRLQPTARQMTYLDSDLLFFSPPSTVLREQGDASVGIVPHRFPARATDLLRWGTFNVGWVSFRRDQDGLACLEWWRARCLEWCRDHVDQGRFADQGYLDDFPKRFGGVKALAHPGINAAPWNVEQQRVSAQEGRIYLGNEPLLFYHFQGIREVMPGWFDPGLRAYRAKLSAELRDLIYFPYLKKLVAVQRRLRRAFGINPVLGYQRLTAGTSWRDRWQRFAVQRLLPEYRRIRGQLIHCPESVAPTEPAASSAAHRDE